MKNGKGGKTMINTTTFLYIGVGILFIVAVLLIIRGRDGSK